MPAGVVKEAVIADALQMIREGKIPPSNMLNDIAGTAASLTIMRAAAQENPGLLRQLENLMRGTVAADADMAKAKNPNPRTKKMVAGLVQVVSQGDKGLWETIKDKYSTAATEIDNDIANSEYENIGYATGLATGTVAFLAAAVPVAKAGVAIGLSGGAGNFAMGAFLLYASGTVGVLAGVAVGGALGYAAYKTIPEVEAGMRKAAAGVRIIAGEAYKAAKELATENVEAASQLNDAKALAMAKRAGKETLDAAREATKESVGVFDTMGQGIVNAWGSAREAVVATINLDIVSMKDEYDLAVEGKARTNIMTLLESSPYNSVADTEINKEVVNELVAEAKVDGDLEAYASDNYKVDVFNPSLAAASMDVVSSLWGSTLSLAASAFGDTKEQAAAKGKVWVEGYFKEDGTKVKGFWRNLAGATGTDAIKEGLTGKQGFAPINA